MKKPALLVLMGLLISCTQLIMYSGYDLNRYSKVENIPLDSIRLNQSDLPNGYKFSQNIMYPDMQTAILYQNPELYEDFVGGGFVLQRATQNVIGPNGDQGTIFYIFYSMPLHEESRSFFQGLLWGGGSPTNQHPEELFVGRKPVIIWGLPTVSRIKSISQAKVHGFLLRNVK